MENKPKQLVFDGIDRTGKSSTLQDVWKARCKIDTCVDRGILSNIVYNKLFKRAINQKEYFRYMPDSKGIFYIYLVADADDIKNRAILTSDDRYSLEEIKVQNQLFDDAFLLLKEYYKKVRFMKIDTSKYNQEEVVNIILKELNNDL